MPQHPARLVAVWLSRVLHPFVTPLPVLVTALRFEGETWASALGWTALCVGVGILPTLALVALERHRRGDGDWFVTVREERHRLYAVGGVSLLVLLSLLVGLGAPALLRAALCAAIVTNAVGAALNRSAKVSIHTGAAAGSAVLLGHVWTAGGAALGVVALALAWARVRLGHHTLAEVAMGGLVSAACVALTLHALT